MYRHKFLQTSHASKSEHRPLPSSEWQVRILGSVVQPSARLLTTRRANLLQCSAVLIGAGPSRSSPACRACALLSLRISRRPSCPGAWCHGFPGPPLVINGPPEIMPITVYLHEILVQMPPPTARRQTLDPPLLDLGCEHRTKPLAPEPDRFMADVDAPLVEQIFHVAQGKREPDIKHHRQANDLGAGLEAAKWRTFWSSEKATAAPCPAQPSFL